MTCNHDDVDVTKPLVFSRPRQTVDITVMVPMTIEEINWMFKEVTPADPLHEKLVQARQAYEAEYRYHTEESQ